MAKGNLTKLAKRLAPAYYGASWPDVEDGVSLSVWVRKEAGEELNLKQAEKLRTLLDAEIDRFPKVVIHVSGGVVQKGSLATTSSCASLWWMTTISNKKPIPNRQKPMRETGPRTAFSRCCEPHPAPQANLP